MSAEAENAAPNVQRHIMFLTFILIFIYLEREKDKYLATGYGINRAYRYF